MKPQYANFKKRFSDDLESCYQRVEEKIKLNKQE